MLYNNFFIITGQSSAWFLLSFAVACHFAEFDTCNLPHAYNNNLFRLIYIAK